MIKFENIGVSNALIKKFVSNRLQKKSIIPNQIELLYFKAVCRVQSMNLSLLDYTQKIWTNSYQYIAESFNILMIQCFLLIMNTSHSEILKK